ARHREPVHENGTCAQAHARIELTQYVFVDVGAARRNRIDREGGVLPDDRLLARLEDDLELRPFFGRHVDVDVDALDAYAVDIDVERSIGDRERGEGRATRRGAFPRFGQVVAKILHGAVADDEAHAWRI